MLKSHSFKQTTTNELTTNVQNLSDICLFPVQIMSQLERSRVHAVSQLKCLVKQLKIT